MQDQNRWAVIRKTMTFETWMERVDAICYRFSGISVYDLPDCTFRIWYDDEVATMTAARRALKMAGFRRS